MYVRVYNSFMWVHLFLTIFVQTLLVCKFIFYSLFSNIAIYFTYFKYINKYI